MKAGTGKRQEGTAQLTKQIHLVHARSLVQNSVGPFGVAKVLVFDTRQILQICVPNLSRHNGPSRRSKHVGCLVAGHAQPLLSYTAKRLGVSICTSLADASMYDAFICHGSIP